MPYGQQEYKASITLAKYLVPVISGGAAVPIMAAIGVLPEDLNTLQETWPMVVVAAASGLIPAVKNFWKNIN